MRLGLLTLAFLLAACATEPTPPDPPAPPARETSPEAPPADTTAPADTLTTTEREAPATDAWTIGVVDGERPLTPPATLQAVRTGAHEGFVRTVFEFGARVPDYHLEYVDHAIYHCASGEPMAIAGDAWLQVRFQIATAHTEAGALTAAPLDRPLDGALLRQLTQTCDFEGDVTWVLGLAAPNPYRVMLLEGPPRLVVDVQR